jgi:putative membrane protein
MRVAVAVWLALAACGTPLVSAHAGGLREWTRPGPLSVWDLAALAALLGTAALYVRGALRLRQRAGRQRRREYVAFAGGWSALVLAVLPPIDAFAVQLFSVHMLQHELMMLAGAPLLIAARPLSTCLWGLPAAWRAAAAGALRTEPFGGGWRVLTAPVIAWAIHGLVIWVWHAPALYDAAVRSEAVHALQHAMFVSSATLFWWGLLAGRYGRAGYGAAVFYVFTTAVHTGLLGAMVTFSPSPLYSVYLHPANQLGVDPLIDQQRAGLLMWIAAGALLTLFGIGLFAAWLGEAERRQNLADRHQATMRLRRQQ